MIAAVPGLVSSHHAQIQKKNHRKRHAMVQIMTGTEEIVPAAAYQAAKAEERVDLAPHKTRTTSECSTKYTGAAALPKWVTNDRQVLRFFAYFTEDLSDEERKNARIRRLVVHYFLADGSIEVCEPRIQNSGLDQGMFLRRSVLKTPENKPYMPEDLVVGNSMLIKGRNCLLVDCDAATREYYTQNNQQQPPAIPYPDTPPPSHWQEIERIKAASTQSNHHRELAKSKAAKVQQFMQYSNSVLRFYCTWDDPHPLYPESRPFVLYYYLADDTIEVRETARGNTTQIGRRTHPILLSRRPLPYEATTPSSVASSPPTRYVRPRDIRCGETLMVFGRLFEIQDCDEFTRTFYLDHFGITQEKMTKQPKQTTKSRDLPEPEDSILQPLLMKSERKTSIRKPLGADQCLRFRAKFSAPIDSVQAARRFILSFYLLDATLAIYEPPVPNSGFAGGKFLDRQNYKLGPPLNRYARASDFVVGASIQLALTPNQPFILLEADEQTLVYCEDHPDEFPKSNIDIVLCHILSQMRHQATSLRHVFHTHASDLGLENTRLLDRDEFEFVLRQLLHLNLHPHEFLTLIRKYTTDGQVWYDDFCDAVSRIHATINSQPSSDSTDALAVLRKIHVNLRQAIRQVASSGRVSRSLLEKLIQFYNQDVPDHVLNSFTTREDGLLDYNAFFDAVYPCDGFDEKDDEEIVDSPRRKPVPTPVPEEGPLYIPTYRSNLDTARFGVVEQNEIQSITSSLENTRPFTEKSKPSSAAFSSVSGESTPRNSSRSSSSSLQVAADSQPATTSAASTPKQITHHVSPIPFTSRFQTTSQRMSEQLPLSTRQTGAPEKQVQNFSSQVELTKEERAALYKTTSQSMTSNVQSTAALTSERAKAVIERAKAKLLQEARLNPLVPMTVTDVTTVDPAACALLSSKFSSHKYQLRRALRDCDREKCGFIGEEGFMNALLSISPDLGEDERYFLADAFFPTAQAQVNYKQLLDTLFSTSAA